MNIEIKDEIERIIRTWGWHQAMPLSEAADEIIKLFPDAPSWKSVREELIQWIADNTNLVNREYRVNADDLVIAIDKLLPSPPEVKE